MRIFIKCSLMNFVPVGLRKYEKRGRNVIFPMFAGDVRYLNDNICPVLGVLT